MKAIDNVQWTIDNGGENFAKSAKFQFEMKNNLIVEKTMDFAVRIVNLYKYLSSEKQEFVMSKQLLRSGTSVGANVREGTQGQSKTDFCAKMSIALKEVCETEYWLELLHKTEYLTDEQYESISSDCSEIAKILTSIVKNSK